MLAGPDIYFIPIRPDVRHVVHQEIEGISPTVMIVPGTSPGHIPLKFLNTWIATETAILSESPAHMVCHEHGPSSTF